MLDEATMQRVARHAMSHQMGMCVCPCFDALMTVGEAVKREGDLRIAVAKVSPDALAALTLAAVDEAHDGE